MAFNVPPPVSLTQRLRDMRVNSDEFFAGVKHHSIKAIASRMGLQNHRVYKTTQEKGGIRVWRLKNKPTVPKRKKDQ